MKFILVILSVSILCAAEFYVFSPDDFTPETLRQDPGEIKRRLDCFIDRAPCTKLTTEYKKTGEDIVATACAKCPTAIKDLIRPTLQVAKAKFPEEYRALRLKYDPTGTNFDRFEDAVGCQRNNLV